MQPASTYVPEWLDCTKHSIPHKCSRDEADSGMTTQASDLARILG